jgi:hydrogenase maturation protease
MWPDDPSSRDVVIGLGNPLMGDDATGLVALERLRAEWDLPGDVELVDGGTWGMSLMPVIEQARRVLFLDAITTGAVAGTVVELARRDLPRRLSLNMSPHQVDLREVLALIDLRGTLPGDAAAIGVEPARVELGEPLSAPVSAAMDAMVQGAIARLRAWGHECRPRAASGAFADA